MTSRNDSCLLKGMKKLPRKPTDQERPAGPKKGDTLELSISNLNDEGFGTATFESKQIQVAGALPGEVVRARVTFTGRRDIYARMLTAIRRSPDRLASPPCPHSNRCDGCPLISWRYQRQLEWKKTLVEQETHRYTTLRKAVIHNVIPSPQPLHYRNSAKLVLAGTFRAPIVGIYRRNSHEVLEIADCPLHNPLINRVIKAVKDGIRKGKVPIFNPITGTGLLRYLVVRVSARDNLAMVVFVTAERNFNEIHHLAKYVREAVPEVMVVDQNVNTSTGNLILGTQDHFLTKDRAIIEELGTIGFSISPRSFFQVNSGSARLIYEKVREWSALSGNETVIDLYCGIGGISLFLAGSCRHVYGIEVVDAAVADAERNAHLNSIENCTFEAGDAAELIDDLLADGITPHLVILNPPRKGCDRQVLEHVAGGAPERIIYVSCSPATLARDLDILAGFGYRTREIQPVDMFPQTPHVENVALLAKDANKQMTALRPATQPAAKPPTKRKRGH